MAIGWMTVLNLVPWGEVIKNAPAVADGAKKLWDSVGNKPAPQPEVPGRRRACPKPRRWRRCASDWRRPMPRSTR